MTDDEGNQVNNTGNKANPITSPAEVTQVAPASGSLTPEDIKAIDAETQRAKDRLNMDDIAKAKIQEREKVMAEIKSKQEADLILKKEEAMLSEIKALKESRENDKLELEEKFNSQLKQLSGNTQSSTESTPAITDLKTKVTAMTDDDINLLEEEHKQAFLAYTSGR